ncbi:MAG TPA: hypothetical protein VGA48_03650 [Thermoplasmata archaeon]
MATKDIHDGDEHRDAEKYRRFVRVDCAAKFNGRLQVAVAETYPKPSKFNDVLYLYRKP